MNEEEMMQEPAEQGQGIGAAAQNIKVPPDMQEAFQKVVLAGMKVMFSKETHQMMLDEIQRPGPVDKRLAEGIVGLMVILWQKSNQTIPPQVIIPAALTLLVEAAEFLEDAGDPATPQDVSKASKTIIQMILEKFGAKPEQIQQLFSGGLDPAAAQQAAQQAPKGIVSGAMEGQA